MITDTTTRSDESLEALKQYIIETAMALGFDDCRIAPVSDVALQPYVAHYQQWLAGQYHGEMGYMAAHGRLRESPAALELGTMRAIVVRMDYMSELHEEMWALLDKPDAAYISRYALGRDYHKVLRQNLQKLASHITERAGEFGYRAFVDSAPVLEKPLAELAGLGWIGKHTNLINSKSGSWFFLGELLVDLPLPIDEPHDARSVDRQRQTQCGSCTRCLDVCPTAAIIAPYVLDARRCISYLTIEYHGSIPEVLRTLMGNRIYGCDDCQLVCPWNKFAQRVDVGKFAVREELRAPELLTLLQWGEEKFLKYFEGSPIRRIGWHSWQRNIAIAIGNIPRGEQTATILAALEALPATDHAVLDEARAWAKQQQANESQ